MHSGDGSARHIVTLIAERTREASDSIFTLVENRDASLLRLHQSGATLFVTDAVGVVLGRFPKGHPLTRPLTDRLEISGFDIIGNASDPTRPNLMIEVRTASRDGDYSGAFDAQHA